MLPSAPDAIQPPGDRAGRLILRGGGANALGFVIRFVARFGFLFAGAQLYGASLLGAYAIALAVVELGVTAGGMGGRWLIYHWIDEREPGRPPRHVVMDAALLAGGTSAILSALVAAGALLVPEPVLARHTATALLLLAPTILIQVLIELLLAATRWGRAIRYDVIGKSVIQPWVGIAVALLAWGAGARGMGLPLSYLVASIVVLTYALASARRVLPPSCTPYHPEAARLRAMAAKGVPTMTSEVSDGLVARLDLWLVGVLLGQSAAGVYGVVKQIAIVPRQVRQSIDGMLVPLVARTVAQAGEIEAGRAIRTAIRLLLVVQIPLLIVFVAVGEPLLGLFGAGFGAGAAALALLTSAEIVQNSFGVADLIFAYRRPRLGLMVTLLGVATAGALAMMLIRPLGMTGAAGAVLGGYSLRAGVRRIVLRRAFGIVPQPGVTAIPLTIGAVAMGAVLALHRMPLAALVAGLTLYAILLLAWRRKSGVALLPSGFVDESP
ncbi:lipopolysaccharide biosynthesis protein [Sphingomonas sp.]|uniref:lipopolysaccharide biosynthesis protein n=1 Tax=Sphingomonas sp. TaxID=28214 RepID=UPI002601BF9F|nr:lipopolysaccharide biosynthesis protein [Sphingomonas sp.]MDF2495649.1 lipopolysaccharide biosynthesis protein [Sphingomonas sp.]